ncbi:hypothetical protein HJFPF1_06952 [Paramyrothecium foliicola]|nr:hypothetical protein HJFPF1_06952 [Paramyrothecium foliicola]
MTPRPENHGLPLPLSYIQLVLKTTRCVSLSAFKFTHIAISTSKTTLVTMGQVFEKATPQPEAGCWYVHRSHDSILQEMGRWLGNPGVRDTDCDCRMRDTCANGPPPMPPWEEFIRPLLEQEDLQPDIVVSMPTAAYPPDATAPP